MLEQLQKEIEKHDFKDQWSILKLIEKRDRDKARFKVNRLFERKIINLEKKCQKCGSTEQIEFHHNDYTKPYIVNMLCKKCHLDFHNGNITIPEPINLESYCEEPIKNKKEQKVEYKRQWLKDLWIEKGFKSSQEIANKCDISCAYIEQIARADTIPSIKVAKKIANVLGFDYKKLREKPISQSKVNQLKKILKSNKELEAILEILKN